MSDNFLKEIYKPSEKVLVCKFTKNTYKMNEDKEEFVRQWVLNWLTSAKIFPEKQIRVEKSHKRVKVNGYERPRTDIKIVEGEKTKLVIECKSLRNRLTDTVFKQTSAYAEDLRAKNIWMTNGKDHWFAVKEGNEWKTKNSLDMLGVYYKRQLKLPDFPEEINPKTTDEYLYKLLWNDPKFQPTLVSQNIMMAFQKMLLHLNTNSGNDSIHSKSGNYEFKDCGPSFMVFGTPAGRYACWHRKYEVISYKDTEMNQLENNKHGAPIYIGANYLFRRSAPNRAHNAQVCVGSLSKIIAPYSLQLNLNCKNCKKNQTGENWIVGHNDFTGQKMSGELIQMIKESGAKHLIHTFNNKERIGLGNLFSPEDCTWDKSKELISNLLEYGLLRQRIKNMRKQLK